MSHSSFLADAQAVRDRGDWLCIFHLTDPTGAALILRFSRRGSSTKLSSVVIGSTTIAAHTPFRKRLLVAPSITQSLWRQGAILASSLPSFGAIELQNADRGLDIYRPINGYTWDRAEIYFCDSHDIQNTIGLVFDGELGVPKYSIDRPVEIPLKGRESLFEAMTGDRVYRGTSYALELFGDRTVSYGTPAAVNITGDLTVETWIWLEALPTAGVVTWGWMGGAVNRSPWRIRVQPNGKLEILPTIGGITEICSTTSAVLGTFTPYHIAIIVTGRDVRFYIWNDDLQTLTTEVVVNAFSSATRDATVDNTYRARSGNDATYKVWFDESRVWNYARSANEIAADRFRPLTTVPATCVHRVGFDDGTGTTVTDSSATAAHGTISGGGTSTWLWICEGGPDLAGTPKPDVFGHRFGVRPVLVDPIRNIYQVAGYGATKSITTFEGGNAHILDANAASLRALITTTPTLGHSTPYPARGLFRLHSTAPTLPISATVEGYYGGLTLGSEIARNVITSRKPLLTDPDDLDTASWTAYEAGFNPGIGIALYQPVPLRDLLDKCMRPSVGWWGYVGASKLFHIEHFTGPSVTPDWNFDQRKIIDIQPLDPQVVIYEVVVRYRPNDVVLGENQVAAVVKGTVDWEQWTLPYLEQRATDDEIRDQFPGEKSISLIVETGIYGTEDARTLANTLLALLKGQKEGWRVVLSPAGLGVKMGQTETLTVVKQDGVECLGLDGGEEYLVVSTIINMQQGIMTTENWR